MAKGSKIPDFHDICEQNLPEENRVVFDEDGSYIENKASGRKAPLRVESRVCVIDVHVSDLIDTGVCGARRAKVTSESVRPENTSGGRYQTRMRPVSADTKNSAAKSKA